MAREPQQLAQVPDSVSLAQFAGLKNVVSAERLSPAELVNAQNIDIDDVGQVRRRRGYTLKSSGNFHSLFSSERTLYGVKNGALGVINPDFSFATIKADVGPSPIAYVHVAENIYYSSATTSGKINHNTKVHSDWGALVSAQTWLSPVVNPTSTLNPISGQSLGKPPLATSLAYFNGRIYLANETTLWATELYLYDYVDKTRNFMQFESPITALGVVTDGIYVGTSTSLYFLSGPMTEMRRLPVDGGVYPGSMVYASTDALPPELAGNSRQSIMYMGPDGLVVGLDGGRTTNLTQTKFLFPNTTNVAAMFRRQDGINQYIGVSDSGGAPTSAARIGDYVDAEIRRFQGA